MKFLNKLKWTLGILMIFAVIISTNLIDRNNFIQVRDSVTTIYEDRLMANDLIFEMSRSVQEKEMAVALMDSVFFIERNEKVNSEIQAIINRFEQTKLTEEESKVFDNLKNNIEGLKRSEKTLIKSRFKIKADLLKGLSNTKENLHDLSKIQLIEGKRQMFISNKAINTVELFTNIEIYLLVVLAILIQIVVMYKPK